MVLRRALAVLLVGGTALVLLHDWFGLGGARFDYTAGGPLYDLIIFAAGVACLVRATFFKREQGAWLLLGLGILCWAAGEVYWTAFILDNPAAPYPAPADVFYLAFYPLAYAGIAMLVRARAHELDWRRWMDAAIAALGTAALGTAFVFDFVADKADGTPLQIATSLAYPLGDIGMLALIVGVVALTDWRPGRTWSLLLVGLAAQGVADIAYTLQSTNGVLPAGSWIDPIYLISAACLGAAVWQPPAATIRIDEESGGWRELMVPAIFASVMIGLFAMRYLGATSSLSAVLWAATMLAVIVRLAISDRQNKALLTQVQTDPLTGLANRGRMQVDLERHCAHATEERPAALLFLDLNGFKRYNDSFGHPAGDLLLAELGGALQEAIGKNGTAYRIGGDEFCVLLTCPENRFEAVTREAAKALTARGSGYDVSAAWGAVEIPSEAVEPSEALQLADVRMYAQKESRRLADRDMPQPSVTEALLRHQVKDASALNKPATPR
ncbi:MAG TPA: GGDEF domain-containing protein [Solirubrobacterales bacterium]